ncbi:alpha/beta hydrolase [Microvirga sp. CF3062]|uniref:alpha/beta fold hydrolase n=1 Tax=Microvirga sp. CF3062 TaxID=3110182 RepID=UPI002E774C1D|nr:alpha/beta hydrolase [Microvirga sp. CF3062]MEE1655463.1 alpha/beta hydrolase [Microvirga sp. CF3062]
MTATNEHPTILLLPGLLCDASVWTAQIEALRPHAHVLVADFSQHDSLGAMARSALAMVEGPVIAIGHSMGARVGMEMVHLAPERIVKLALIDTGVDSRREGEEAKRQVLVDLAYAEGMGALADRWLPPMVHADRAEDKALLAPLKKMVMRATPEQHQRQIRALLNRPNLMPRLAGIACPTLVMVGRQDRWSPLAQHEEMAARIPNAELVVIEDSGHMTLLEQPEQVSNVLLRWLGVGTKLAGTHTGAAMER